MELGWGSVLKLGAFGISIIDALSIIIFFNIVYWFLVKF